jgi:hypothetical protein
METNFKNKVTKSAFLNWYFSDADDIKTIGHRVIEGLKADGTITLSVDELFNNAAYIPQHICEVDGAEKDYLSEDEYHPSEVELIDDIANKKNNQETIFENNVLFSTDYVIYDKANDNVIQFGDGNVVIFADKQDAIKDCYKNEIVIPCTQLPKHWQEIIIKQIKTN